ncbi:MAG: carboxypeptidase-like regulatory domain-containing protein, partial [Bryobacteraceae bacterium]
MKNLLSGIAVSVMCLLVGSASAQVVSGTMVGTAVDASGSVVPNAAVTLTNDQTNISFKTATDEAGNYVAPNLPPGRYTVKAEASGFKPYLAKGISALSNRTVRADVALETGTITQSVEVDATAPVVNSESSAISSVMEGRAIVNLPLNGRGLDQLVLLGAGVMQLDNANNPRVGGSPYWGGTQFNV